HRTLVADAAGNSLLVVDQKGSIDWVATFPEQDGAQAVPTSVAIGSDGAYYVGELTGSPFPTGVSRVWRVEPGARHAACGTSPACSIVVTGRTAIIDLQFGPDGRLYLAQLDDAGLAAFEGGTGVGGSVHACNVTTGACEQIVAGIPMLTAIAFRGTELWGTTWSLIPEEAPPESPPSVAFLPRFDPLLFSGTGLSSGSPRIDRADARVQVLDVWWENSFAPRHERDSRVRRARARGRPGRWARRASRAHAR